MALISDGGSGASVSGHPNWNRDKRGEPYLNIALTSIAPVTGTVATKFRVILQDQTYLPGSATLTEQLTLEDFIRGELTSMTDAQWADVSWISLTPADAIWLGQTESELSSDDLTVGANATIKLPTLEIAEANPLDGAIDTTAGRLITQERGTFINLTADGVAYSGPCILRRVVINTGTAGACIVYDNTAASGTIIATIAGANPGEYNYGCACANGIYINLTAGQDVTVIYEPI